MKRIKDGKSVSASPCTYAHFEDRTAQLKQGCAQYYSVGISPREASRGEI
ncbi:hypothetical protein [Thalassovita taeanensis]|nr:hypothetical protein [Thalassovita taeanensis]